MKKRLIFVLGLGGCTMLGCMADGSTAFGPTTEADAGFGVRGTAPGAGGDGGAYGSGSSDSGGSRGSDAGSSGNGGTSGSDAGSAGNGGTSGSDAGSSGNGGSGGTGAGSSDGGATSSQLFPSDSPWYRDVSSYPVASSSSTIIGAIGSWGNGGHFDVDFSFNVMHANASTPHYTASLDPGYDPDNDHTAVPVPAGGALEGESGYRCTTGGDCHLMVIDDSTHKLFEIWQADFDGSKLTGTQETAWDLLRHYDASGRGYGCTSADAAGMSILAGTIGVKETHAGAIDHAIRFILPNSKIRSAFVAPATHLTGAASSSNGPPYGTRLRMKASFDESKLPSQGAKIVARALKKYGMILADGGQVPISAETDALYPASLSWSGLLGAADLRSITVSDFDVVDFGTVRTDSNCVRTP